MKEKTAIIKRDVLQSLWDCKYIYAGIMLLFIVINFSLVSTSAYSSGYNFFSIIIEGYGGIPFASRLDKIVIPVKWLITNSFIVFIVTNVINKNFSNSAIYVLTRARNRRMFWISKLIAIIANVLVYYIIVFFTLFLIVIISPKGNFNSINMMGREISDIYIVFVLIMLYITTSILLCFLSATIGVLTDPKYAAFIIIAVMMVSLIFDSSLLPAQGSIIFRHIPFDSRGISIMWSTLYNILGSLVVWILGSKFISIKDIL